ncbi:MAG: hypothetical protein CSB21_03375 [Deltaproteobacteria bacterium]|nr:MAG: hypothetical protein CSB21_03375 [Deltaproteobacteria bacterium]
MSDKNIALIELYRSHSECLYSQYLYLKKAGFNIFLISNEIPAGKLSNAFDFEDSYILKNKGNFFLWMKSLYQINKFLKKNNISTAVINTAENSKVRDLLFFCPKINFFGILHHIRKLEKSFSQKSITSKIRGYFTLSNYLTEKASNLSTKVHTLYTIFYPDSCCDMGITKDKNDIWVCIPGNIELKRRSYIDLIQAAATAGTKRIKFLLLGKPDPCDLKKIKKLVYSKKLGKNFIWFDNYLKNDLFFTYIRKSDFIMPLIHEEHFEEYKSNRISGSFNLGFGFQKPFIMEQNFSGIPDFDIFSIYYDEKTLAETLKYIDENHIEITSMIKKRIKENKLFLFENLQNKFLNIISEN